jgi:hypothetical protein
MQDDVTRFAGLEGFEVTRVIVVGGGLGLEVELAARAPGRAPIGWEREWQRAHDSCVTGARFAAAQLTTRMGCM